MITPEHRAIMEADDARRFEAAMLEGLRLRGMCEAVLSAKTMGEAVAADDALMISDEGDVCPCAIARRTLIALSAERRDERRQTQRRMIAALYWRAGEALLKERAAHTKWIVAQDRGERARHARVADNFGHVQDALETAASAMEAAL